MEETRSEKIKAGLEKLAAYKKKKEKNKGTSSSDTDTSLSSLLKDNGGEQKLFEEPTSENNSSIISEHINFDSDSFENDRSFQEIEISNIPTPFSVPLQDLPLEPETSLLHGTHCTLSSHSGTESTLNSLDKSSCKDKTNVVSFMHCILDEILQSNVFESDTGQTLCKSGAEQCLEQNYTDQISNRSDYFDSEENSFNLFKGLNLNDSLITNVRTEKIQAKTNTVASENVDESALKANIIDLSAKVKHLEEIVTVKDTVVAALTSELESLKEIQSNTSSTLNSGTSTEYKQVYEEFQSKVVDFQNALAFRDNLIQQLTESLQQSVIRKEQLQGESEKLAQEIISLQKQLLETSALIDQHDCKNSNTSAEAKKELKESGIQIELDFINDYKVKKKNETNEAETQTNINQGIEAIAEIKNVSEDDRNTSDQTSDDSTGRDLSKVWSELEATLNPSLITQFQEIKENINVFVEKQLSKTKLTQDQEMKILKDELLNEKQEHKAEVLRLRELIANMKSNSVDIVQLREELEYKHAKEMEELRTYFEQKCADLEKHYSEEVFSQQSRKLSSSSSCSGFELTSDFIPTSEIGPGGDCISANVDFNKNDFSNLKKCDLQKLKDDLVNIMKDLEKFDLDKITKQELNLLKSELAKYDLRSLMKYNLSDIRNELQSQYHAELEILREDYENRIDLVNVEHSKKMHSLERKYGEQIESLKGELDEALKNNVNNNGVQEVTSSGEYELAEVVQSYERRLQEQVVLAKIDIINALELQIQMLVANTEDDVEWPSELLQLRDRFTERYEKKIAELNEVHTQEITKLKEEHLKNLNGAIERAKRRSLRDSLTQDELEIIQERDNLRKTTSILRGVINQLIKYFSRCEDELNNTLIEEIFKQGIDKSVSQFECDISTNQSASNDVLSNSFVRKVHFTPNFANFLVAIDSSLTNLDVDEVSSDLENELTTCLRKLRNEANEILALTLNTNVYKEIDEIDNARTKQLSVEDKMSSLMKQLVNEHQIKSELTAQLKEAQEYIKTLENERVNLESQIEQLVSMQRILESDLVISKEKIAELIESGHNEIVSEGYGEKDLIPISDLGEQITSFTELQEKARNLITECPSNVHSFVQLIEDLCRAGEKMKNEARKEHLDLKQQIEAADKKIRATSQFLEEQAAEREQERDEAQKEISLLKDQIREREKDRASCERINKEDGMRLSFKESYCNLNITIMHRVEHLEQQMREMSKLMEENELRTKEIELEKQEAIDKIYVLRDIIRDLESQVEAKTESEVELQNLVTHLQQIIKQQNKSNEDLHQQLDSIQNVGNIQEHVEKLENEVQRLRLNNELIGKEGILQQIKKELNELEVNIEKRTHDLEVLHATISATSCSSPSEDMSIRDQACLRPSPAALEECHVPLQQLARLKEKLLIHSRAEDAAIKRIRDLEMQLDSIRNDLEESQNEKDILQDQVSQQLVLISSLQMRLDEQRLRVEQAQKQTNTSLELQIYDLESEIQNLKEIVHNRDKTIKHLQKTIDQTRQRLEDREKELSAKIEDKMPLELQKQIQQLQEENEILRQRINSDVESVQILPSLVDNILADKNRDIEILREKLNDTQRELEVFLSLNLDKEQLKSLSKLKSSDRAFSDILTLIDISEGPEPLRKVGENNESLTASLDVPFKRNFNETILLGSINQNPQHVDFETEISEIEKVGCSNINYTTNAPLTQPNSTELGKSLEKRVHFEDIENLEENILKLKEEINLKNEIIKDYTERLKILGDLEENINKLQEKLDFTEEALRKTSENFEIEKDRFKKIEKDLLVELAEKKMYLTEKEKELGISLEDSARKDKMYMDLVKEKRDLEKQLQELQEMMSERNNQASNLVDPVDEITKLQEKVGETEHQVLELKEKCKDLEQILNRKLFELEQKSGDLMVLNEQLLRSNELNEKLEKDLDNKEKQVNSMSLEIKDLNQVIDEKNIQIKEIEIGFQEEDKTLNILEEKLKKLQVTLSDRDMEIQILNEDINHYQEEIANLESKNNELLNSIEKEKKVQEAKISKELAEKDLQITKDKSEIDDLKYDINHLQHLLLEKEKIIKQISDDSKSLHINLETIQNKMRESGNIVDLKRRLQEEQQLTASLKQEVEILKLAIKNGESNNPQEKMTTSIEEITGQVQKQLNYSAILDSNILSALGNGDSNANSLVLVDDMQFLKDALLQEKNTNAKLFEEKHSMEAQLSKLEQDYETQRQNISKLQLLLEKERRNVSIMQMENANILEQMRLRLETALENEIEFENKLKEEKINRKEMEKQLALLKQKAGSLSTSDNSKTELTEYKSLPTLESQELIKLRKNLQILQDENQKLIADLKDIKKVKNENDANLKYLKEMLQFKHNELEKLEQKIEGMQEVEDDIKEKWFQTKSELEQRNREIENSRILINELEDYGRTLKHQIKELQKKLQQVEDIKGNTVVPEKFIKKMKELNSLVKEQVKDNKLMSETLSKLTDERQRLQQRVNELENCMDLPFSDVAARANHLFARYLKSESYRKALVWQKRYLVSLLATYQDFRPIVSKLPLSTFDIKINNENKTHGTKRFKILAISIVVIIRMQYLVRRWQTGKRFGAHLHFSSKKYNIQAINQVPTYFQVGQLASSENFDNQCATQFKSNKQRNSNYLPNKKNRTIQRGKENLERSLTPPVVERDLGPWSGYTPPSKDHEVIDGLDKESVIGNPSTSCEAYTPLQAPQLLLSQYFERFDQIQQRLGIAIEENSTT